MANTFGGMLKRLRMGTGKTLREFCLENGLDPGNYSRLERGRMQPPGKHELLEKYATALAVEADSDDWIELFDLAAAERGKVPADLMSDAEVVEKLPVLFRTLRAKRIDGDDLDGLVDLIRRS